MCKTSIYIMVYHRPIVMQSPTFQDTRVSANSCWRCIPSIPWAAIPLHPLSHRRVQNLNWVCLGCLSNHLVVAGNRIQTQWPGLSLHPPILRTPKKWANGRPMVSVLRPQLRRSRHPKYRSACSSGNASSAKQV